MKEAKLYIKSSEKNVSCRLCSHFCCIKNGETGICGVRQNLEGKLISLNYRKLAAEAVDPIEKKPVYHMLPGSKTYSIASVGCNFRCENCQNWEISQAKRYNQREKSPNPINISGYEAMAEDVIKHAVQFGCRSVSYTYTEPTVFFEFALECMKLAKENGLKNIWVTNGYMSDRCLKKLIPYLDAANVDLKFFDDEIYQKNCGGRLEPVLRNMVNLKQSKIWLEVTTLIIPDLTDRGGQLKKISDFIANLSTDVPWHITRFSPEISFKLANYQDTPFELLEQAYLTGKNSGLKYVYIGNLEGSDRNNTYCDNCGYLLIKRTGYKITANTRTDFCPNCSKKFPLINC